MEHAKATHYSCTLIRDAHRARLMVSMLQIFHAIHCRLESEFHRNMRNFWYISPCTKLWTNIWMHTSTVSHAYIWQTGSTFDQQSLHLIQSSSGTNANCQDRQPEIAAPVRKVCLVDANVHSASCSLFLLKCSNSAGLTTRDGVSDKSYGLLHNKQTQHGVCKIAACRCMKEVCSLHLQVSQVGRSMPTSGKMHVMRYCN